MNPLLSLILAAGLCAGVTAWQQQSIDRLRANISLLSAEMVATRNAVEAERASLAANRARLKDLQAGLQAAKAERAAAAVVGALPLPTPAQEGWWPEGRPYFYLAKKYLPNVRFDDRPVHPEDLSDELKALVAQQHIDLLDYKLFNNDGLNAHMAVLLGMSDDEVAAVNDTYSDLARGVREVEAARIVRVEPPEPAGDGKMLVARLPDLSSELQPLIDRWDEALEQRLGLSRAELLRDRAKQYFDEDWDHLGDSYGREFLILEGSLFVRYTPPSGDSHYKASSFHVNENNRAHQQDWEYGHLFGPGAPCELK